MIAVKGVLTLFWLLALPFCLGLPFQRGQKPEKKRFCYTMLAGWAALMALFQLMAVPMILLRLSYRILALSFGLAAGGLALASLVRNRGEVRQLTGARVRALFPLPWSGWLALGLVGVQLVIYAAGMLKDLDDALYVGAAVTAQYTDGMYTVSALTGKAVSSLPARYCLSPFPMLLAFFSSATGFSPSVMAHTIEPVFFVSLAYGVYGLLGERLFKGDRGMNGMFLAFLSVIHLFSYYSIYTQGTFLLLRIWQGKAFLAAALLPGLFYMVMKVMGEDAGRADWVLTACLALSACLVSSMGIMLAPILMGILGVVLGCFLGKWKKTVCLALCCIPSLCYAGIYVLIR